MILSPHEWSSAIFVQSAAQSVHPQLRVVEGDGAGESSGPRVGSLVGLNVGVFDGAGVEAGRSISACEGATVGSLSGSTVELEIGGDVDTLVPPRVGSRVCFWGREDGRMVGK